MKKERNDWFLRTKKLLIWRGRLIFGEEMSLLQDNQGFEKIVFDAENSIFILFRKSIVFSFLFKQLFFHSRTSIVFFSFHRFSFFLLNYVLCGPTNQNLFVKNTNLDNLRRLMIQYPVDRRFMLTKCILWIEYILCVLRNPNCFASKVKLEIFRNFDSWNLIFLKGKTSMGERHRI